MAKPLAGEGLWRLALQGFFVHADFGLAVEPVAHAFVVAADGLHLPGLGQGLAHRFGQLCRVAVAHAVQSCDEQVAIRGVQAADARALVKELKHQRILGSVAVGWGDGFAFRLVFAGERRGFFRAFCQRLFERVAAFVQGGVGLFVAIVGLDLGAYVGKRARLRFFAFADGEEQGALRPDFYGFADFVVGQGLGAKELCLYFRLVQPGGGVAVGGDGAQALGLAAGDAGDGRQAFAVLCGVKGLVGVFGVGGFVFAGGKAAHRFRWCRVRRGFCRIRCR